jgi:hypothetical protein
MIDEEVESVLREIRERVRSATVKHPRRADRSSSNGNGDGEALITATSESETSLRSDALPRLDAYRTTTARAWDRLPPVVSNRSGFMARLELWLKAKSKSLTRWFTWEQTNFNAAVHHAIGDTVQALKDHEVAMEEQRAELRRLQNELAEMRDALEKETVARTEQIDAIHAENEKQQTETDSLRSDFRRETDAQRTHNLTQRAELNGMRAEIRGETEARRIRIEDLQKQLQVLIDRADKK